MTRGVLTWWLWLHLASKAMPCVWELAAWALVLTNTLVSGCAMRGRA